MRSTLGVKGSTRPCDELCIPGDHPVDGFNSKLRGGSRPRHTCRCDSDRLAFEGRDEVAAGLAVVVAVDGAAEGVCQQGSRDPELLGLLLVELALGDERDGVCQRIVDGRLQWDILAVRGVAFLDLARKKVERGQAVGLGRIEVAAERDDEPCRLLGLLASAELDGPDSERRDDHGRDNDRRREDEDSERPLADSPILVRHEDDDAERAGLGIRVVENEGLVRVEGQRLGSCTIPVIDRGGPGLGAGVGERADSGNRRSRPDGLASYRR